jgi:hypothetical protein
MKLAVTAIPTDFDQAGIAIGLRTERLTGDARKNGTQHKSLFAKR